MIDETTTAETRTAPAGYDFTGTRTVEYRTLPGASGFDFAEVAETPGPSIIEVTPS
jgi:hypothetical protein